MLELVGLSVQPGNDLHLSLATHVGDGGRALLGRQCQCVSIAHTLV